MSREQLQRWRYTCDGHYQNGLPCPVSLVVDATDVVDANQQMSRQGWRTPRDDARWLCGYSLHAEDVR